MVVAGKHVGDIERSWKIVKESTQCHVHRNTYERYTRMVVTVRVVKSIEDLNQIPQLNNFLRI